MSKIKDLLTLIEDYNSKSDDKINVRENELLSKHSSFRIGGAADLFLAPSSIEALRSLLEMISSSGVKFYILGNGTNVLFDDNGFRGAVISLSEFREMSFDGTFLHFGAGVSLGAACIYAKELSLSGMEFAYGIPGSIGGAVYMNAGAYGGEIKDVLVSSTYLDLSDLSIHTISLDEHRFGYRDSIYKHSDRIILSADFRLESGDREEISEAMNTVMNKRKDKQPLEYPSAGSVFKRCEGHFTGQMIEELGLKGYRIGGAQISEKHAGFIVNRGGATAVDVMSLVEFIQEKVKENYYLDLECEIIRISE